jgi:hypothetical protein
LLIYSGAGQAGAANMVGWWRTGAMLVLAATALAAGIAAAQPHAPEAPPAYTAKGELEFPSDYRTWVYLSSGYNMSYSPMSMPNMSQFDNVFVNPAAYAAFLKTGTWPDKTVMVLEARQGETRGSINQAGRFQTQRLAVEVHVKDVARFPGGWAFFGFSGEGPGQLVPQSQPCYACHAGHAGVDTTFVQFYPTLKPIAAAMGTFSASYLADEAAGRQTH